MNIRTILVICADCDVGFRLVQLAGRSEYNVIAAIRPYTEAARYERLGAETVLLDPSSKQEIKALFANLNPDGLAVACVLGGTPHLNSQGNINVIQAAEEIGVRRFMLQTSIGCGDSADAVDEFVRAFVGKALTAKTWAERVLQATELDWTIIRAGGVMRRQFKGGAILLESKTVSGHINPNDLADVMFDALISAKTNRRILAAVDAEEAYEASGEPVVAVEI